MLDSQTAISTSNDLREETLDNYHLQFDRWVQKYQSQGQAVEVNFREIVKMHSGIDRATHLMHSYPAKLLLNIPNFFLNVRTLAPGGGIVLDPFCGTGTVLVESLLAGKQAIGADSNPLARLIALAKTTPITQSSLVAAHKRVVDRVGRSSSVPFSPVMDVDHWFSPATAKAMAALLGAIRETRNIEMRRFFEVCFSSCVRRLSYADPRLSVPVQKREDLKPLPGRSAVERVRNLYEKAVRVNSRRIANLPTSIEKSPCHIFTDARTLPAEMRGASVDFVDMVITSPPYVGAQKYIRSSSLSIGWLGLAPENKLRILERDNIGREHYGKEEVRAGRDSVIPEATLLLKQISRHNELRAHIAANYLCEMNDAFTAACSVLRPGGHFVLIAGDNSIAGKPFFTTRYLRQMLENLGLRLKLELIDNIKSRGLMTKRNKTAGIISREHIFVFQNP